MDQYSVAMQEEMRKNISHMADQERSTAQHKAQVEHHLQKSKLDLQKSQTDYQLQKEHEQFLRHDQIRLNNQLEIEEAIRETMRIKARLDRDVALEGAKADAEGRAQQDRENIEVRLREMRARQSEERATKMQAIEEIFGSLASGMSALYEDRSKATALIAGLTALAVGVYSARAGTRVASTVIEQHLGRPPLVRETSRWSWRPSVSGLFGGKPDGPSILEGLVLEQTLAERLQWTTNALVSAQDNGTPFRHLLLHGAPGTGKTLFARTLARHSGLDYAIMSGGDIGPLGREGPNELHKLFRWANSSRRGLVLFIDEADAFLRSGRGAEGNMSEDARNALSVFLHHTGTESRSVAVILATNIPRSLDRAVLDRMDEHFEFPLPAEEQRLKMINMFFDRYIRSSTSKGWNIKADPDIDDKFLADIAKKTDGFSGRQLAKLALAFQSAVFGSGTKVLTRGLADTVVQWRLSNPNGA
jgi:ATPase family AAA domain-containing protein 3A/B